METERQMKTLLEKYIKICKEFGKKSDKSQGIELSYQEINDIWFDTAEKEKNRILEKLGKMNADEKEAYHALSILRGKQTTNKYKEVLEASKKARKGDEGEEPDINEILRENEDGEEGEEGEQDYAEDDEAIVSGGEDMEDDGNNDN
jgi:hypothetical protein